MIDAPPLNPHGLPSATAIEIALTLWEIGLASEIAVTDWADAQILALEHPSADLIELSANGVKLCLNRNSIESRSIKLTFIEQFALKAHLLDLACDRSAEDFIAWVSRNCWGENLKQPELLLSYHLDHLYCDCDDLSAAIQLLRNELPPLLPNCSKFATTFLSQVPDLAIDWRSKSIPNIERHQTRSSVDILQILDYIENDLIPLMLDGFEQKPHSMLGGSLGQLLNAINCAIVVKYPDAAVQRYLNLFHTVALCHFQYGNGGDPFDAKIDGKTFHFSPEAHSEYMGLDTWANAVHACAIVGDIEGICWLCKLTEDVFTDSDGTHAPSDLAYYRYWVDFSNGGHNAGHKAAELLNWAIETATQMAQAHSLRQKFINTIRQPELRLLQAILDGDAANFNRQLLSALEAHKQFWSQPSHSLIPEGWISLPLLAACVIARNQHNFSIEVISDYLPQQLIDINWGSRVI